MMLRYTISIALLALIAVPGAAAADPLARCAAIEDDSARLRCFDAAIHEASSPAVQPGSTAEDEPRPEARSQPIRSVDPDARPGRETEVAPPDARTGAAEPQRWRQSIFERDEISALLVEHRTDPRGRWIFVLDNGQVWQQMDSTARLRLPPNREPRVVIREQLLGGYMLKLAGNRAVQAKRVK